MWWQEGAGVPGVIEKSEEQFFRDKGMGFVELRRSRSSARFFRPHMHRSFSVGCVDSGAVRFIIGDQGGVLRPGGLVLVNPEMLHACNSLNRTRRSYSMLYLDVKWCLQVQQALRPVEGFVPVQRSHLVDRKLYRRFQSLVRILIAAKNPRSEKEQVLVAFFSELFRTLCSLDIEYGAGTDEKVVRMKELLASNLADDLTLESLAGRLDCNPYTLLRRFRAQTGITPHAYRMNCRVEQARKFLQQGMDIGETALQCGFFDQSHFHRFFKGMTTVTPREYKLNFIQ